MPARHSFASTCLAAISIVAAYGDWLVAAELEFERDVAPLLAAKCVECHSGNAPKGGIDLSTKSGLLKGGETGVAVEAGKPDDSLLWHRVADDEMPPRHPLSEREKATLRNWISGGAKWTGGDIDRFRYTSDSRAGYDWWSLQPVRKVSPPLIGKTDWPRNSIDNFVLKRLIENQLSPSKQATARKQLRRLYFDLIGLPPSPEVVATFVAAPTDEAYLKIVDELLASQRYGERWARHWLDVVRFGESNGFERNAPRTNFWYYRDWVINSLNNDMPYDEFARMQLIGDLLKPGPEGAASTGFLVAGIHNTTVGGSERMKKLARQDELEEVIAAVGQTFLGLTVNCARCHDHKFDPIKQTEYYQLISTISGMNHGERVERTEAESRKLAELSAELAVAAKKLSTFDGHVRNEILAARKKGEIKQATPPKPFAQWNFDNDLNDSIGSLHGKIVGSAKLEGGALVVDGKSYVETTIVPTELKEKTLEAWVQVDTLDQSGGGAISLETPGGGIFDAIVYAEREKRRWMAGSNGFVRTESFNAAEEDEAAKQIVHVAIVYKADGTIIGYRNGQPYGSPIRKSGLQTYAANGSQVLFGLRHSPGGGNRFLSGCIHKASLYDTALSSEAVAASAGTDSDYVSDEELVDWLTPENMKERATLKSLVTTLTEKRQQVEAASNRNIYTMNPGKPAEIRFLTRDDIEQEGEVVSPGAVASVSGVSAAFGLTPAASDAERRKKLADWITSPDNPLFARVIVNRIWQYHFGSGLVTTASDFGFNGGQPSHPELLDWLVGQFKTNGLRLKPLHRLIVTSATYRQGSPINHVAQKIDADNRLLWRKAPRRLEAEVVRDAILSASGKLNATMGGPGFQDVKLVPNNGTTYYEPFDADGDEFFRRTIYRFTPRGGRSALLDTFDCPDPATAAPRRAVTTTPLQALSLLNNSFVLRMSNYSAERIAIESGTDPSKQIERAWQLTLARSPNDSERQASERLATQHGLPALCRGLFNVNEFVLVD
ncbi:MAG: DUF1553 domain-containing protein [Rhodopirellula sp.]|nr:DUF1553 domain-containing protein [Rhodopirellula sp.]